MRRDRVASLTLVNPPIIDAGGLCGLASRMLSIAGDVGPTAEGAVGLLAEFPEAAFHILHGFECHPWSDVIADHGSEIAPRCWIFSPGVRLRRFRSPRGKAKRMRFPTGFAVPPLVLMSLDLASSQWEPLIPTLGVHYCTITLSGPLLGAVGVLEAHGRSTYLGLIRTRPGRHVTGTDDYRDPPAGPRDSTALRAKVYTPGLVGAGAALAGCADASLYSRFHAAGLAELKCFPQLVAMTPPEASRFGISKQQIKAVLTVDEAAEWRSAAARAETAGTLFVATGHHCAVGRKPG